MSRPRFGIAMLWSLVMNVGENSLNSLVTIALGVYLGPDAFGLIAIALVYFALIELVLDQGLSAALVQLPELDDTHLDTAFWMVIAGSAVLVIGSLGLSEWWAKLNGAPDLEQVIYAMAVIVPLNGLTVVQRAIVERAMDFKILALRSNVSVIVGGAVGLTLAVLGFGYWALVAQNVGRAVVGLALLWSLSHWRPHLRFSRSAAGDLFGVSSGAFLGRLGVFVNNRSDALLIGLFFGHVTVGLYRLGERLVTIIANMASRSIELVALPEFSRLQSDRALLVRSVIRCSRLSANMIVPWLAVLAATASEITALLGSAWEPAAQALQFLCFVGMARAGMVLTAPLMRAMGWARTHAGLVWLHAIPSALCIFAAALWFREAPMEQQAAGIAWTRAALFVVLFLPVNLAVPVILAGVPLTRLLGAVAPAVLAGLAAWLGSFIGGFFASAAASSEPAKAFFVVVCSGSFAVLTLLLADAELRRWLRRIAGEIQRGLPSNTPRMP